MRNFTQYLVLAALVLLVPTVAVAGVPKASTVDTSSTQTIGGSKTFTNTATFNSHVVTLGYFNPTNAYNSYRNLTSSSLYGTGGGGAAVPWSEAGHLVLEPRQSGNTRYVWLVGPSGTAVGLLTGTGSPEASKTAPVGSLYLRTDGGAATTLYVKESGTGNTGWVAK